MVSLSIIQLDSTNPVHVKAVAQMHNTLLPKSPIPQLGFNFMTKFYYSKLVNDDLIACALCSYCGKYVGFISYTKYPYSFMEEGKRRHLSYLLFLLAMSVICNPYRLIVIYKVIRQKKMRQIENNSDDMGEVLSFGVLEQYRQIKDATTGLRISHLLFRNVIANLANEGFRNMQVSVAKGNQRALSFYLPYASSIKNDNLGGSSQVLLTVKL